jgi:hypothetical protein
MLASSQQGYAQTACYQHPPKILVLRGVFEIFSLGMNDLTRKLVRHGYDAKVTSWSMALLKVNCDDQRPLVIIGHSLGGRMCGWTSRKMMRCGQRVPLIIIVDANLFQSIPRNVDKCLNLYVTNKLGVFHGSPVHGETPSTQIVNWDVSRGQPSMFVGGINHFNIDATAWIHEIIIKELDATFRPTPATRTTDLRDEPRRQNSSTLARPRRDLSKSVIALSKHRQVSAPPKSPAGSTLPDQLQAEVTSIRLADRVVWRPTRQPRFGKDLEQAVPLRPQAEATSTRLADKVVWRPTRPPRFGEKPGQTIQ